MIKKQFTFFPAIILLVFMIIGGTPVLAKAAADTVKPTISGTTNKTIYIGASFNPISGVTAKDNVDGNITKNIKVSGSVNTKKVGTYKLVYSVSDKAQNKATVTRTITVKKDTTKPKISGASNKTIYVGSSFKSLAGVTAKDNADGTITKNIKVSGSVNIKKAGSYKLTYTVSDKAKNKTTVTRTITVKKDSSKPTISGTTNKTIYVGSSFRPLDGVTAKDNVDGIITKNIKVSGTVNIQKAGTYKLTYSVSDKAKNKTTVTRTITVKKDTIKPSISGATNKSINIGSSFNPLAGVTAKDNLDGNITKNIKITGSVNVKKAGNYKITYTISDKAKNKTTIVRNIKVIDNVKPVITGVKDIQLHVGETINILEGISATDNNDGNLTSKIKVEGSVNFKKAGTYMLTYSVTDQSGNITSISRKITVIDNVNPVLLGVQDIVIPFGQKFEPLAGISASDNSDGDLTSSIRVNGSVNINKAGSYALTYSVSDQSGNTVSTNRVVTVVDNIKPVISGTSDITIGLYTEFNLLDGIKASDNNDGDLTSFITTAGSVDTLIEGQYTVTYKVSDAAGNIAEITRIITVQKIPVSDVSIVAPDTMKTGKTQQLTAIVTPMDATNQQIIWQSSDESIATISEDGLLETILEGTLTITATVDGISTSKTITISDRPNVYPYISGKSTINGVIKSFSISIINQEFSESVFIDKIDIYENNRLFTSHSAESLQNSGIDTNISPRSSWGITLSFKLGIWANQSEVVVTVRTENGKTYQYPLSI